MRCNAAGLALIKSFESCRLEAYRCPRGILTIGWGHTGPDVLEGMVWTQAQADAAFAADVEAFEAAVARAVTVVLTPNQFSALVSFAYNVIGWRGSTLLRKLNSGDPRAAAEEFPRWCHAGGLELAGLLRRRQAERALFLA